MTKTDKKKDKQIREILTVVCEIALESYPGFKWLTHRVNYKRFPDSLSIICVFATREQVSALRVHNHDKILCELIKEKLLSDNVIVKDIFQHVSFDSEESCWAENNGRWSERLY